MMIMTMVMMMITTMMMNMLVLISIGMVTLMTTMKVMTCVYVDVGIDSNANSNDYLYDMTVVMVTIIMNNTIWCCC